MAGNEMGEGFEDAPPRRGVVGAEEGEDSGAEADEEDMGEETDEAEGGNWRPRGLDRGVVEPLDELEDESEREEPKSEDPSAKLLETRRSWKS